MNDETELSEETYADEDDYGTVAAPSPIVRYLALVGSVAVACLAGYCIGWSISIVLGRD